MPNEATCFRPLKFRRMAARRGFRLGHDGLPLALGSLCARLAAFHFEIKAKMNADDPCESPAEQPSGPSEPRTLPNKDKTKHSRRGQREGRGEHPPERDSIVSYSPASNFAMASRNASP